MIFLSIISLIIAGVSALFGIWTARNLVVRNAIIATTLTSLGLAIGITLAWLQHLNAIAAAEAAQKREVAIREQFRVLQTTSVLNTLEVKWTFPDAPESLTSAIALSEAIELDRRLSDDEFDRMPQIGINSVIASWHIDNAVVPILVGLADPNLDAKSLYHGDVE